MAERIDTQYLIGRVPLRNEAYQIEVNVAVLNEQEKPGIDIRRWKVDGEDRRPLKGAFFTMREAKIIAQILHDYFTEYYEKPLIEENES